MAQRTMSGTITPVINLRDAVLCCACDSIWPFPSRMICPLCGEKQFLAISRIITPMPEQPDEEGA